MRWPLNATPKIPKSRAAFGYSANFPKLRLNKGTDLVTKPGAHVFSIDDGVVQKIHEYKHPTLDSIDKPHKSYAVIIQNEDGTYILYGNINKPTVKIGDLVNPGKSIGSVSKFSAYYTEQPHLHIEHWSRLPKKNEVWYIKNKPKGLLSSTNLLSKIKDD